MNSKLTGPVIAASVVVLVGGAGASASYVHALQGQRSQLQHRVEALSGRSPQTVTQTATPAATRPSAPAPSPEPQPVVVAAEHQAPRPAPAVTHTATATVTAPVPSPSVRPSPSSPAGAHLACVDLLTVSGCVG